MALPDVIIGQIKAMNHDELLRTCLNPDSGVVVEVIWRLERTTRWLNVVLIAVTIALVMLTGILVYRAICTA